MGRVALGPESSVWFGAVVRADQEDVSIGGRTNIQDNAVLHADPGFPLTVGDDVSIGHAAVVHGCTIEQGVLVGMGSVIMNGAVVGAGSTIAAGAVVLGGTVVPPASLVAGVPAKVRRRLDDSEVEANQFAARLYVDLATQHREGSFPARRTGSQR
jgi:carbonic anhydrase/acetyltransferase-like protein (isoleucine patch superfamily)